MIKIYNITDFYRNQGLRGQVENKKAWYITHGLPKKLNVKIQLKKGQINLYKDQGQYIPKQLLDKYRTQLFKVNMNNVFNIIWQQNKNIIVQGFIGHINNLFAFYPLSIQLVPTNLEGGQEPVKYAWYQEPFNEIREKLTLRSLPTFQQQDELDDAIQWCIQNQEQSDYYISKNYNLEGENLNFVDSFLMSSEEDKEMNIIVNAFELYSKKPKKEQNEDINYYESIEEMFTQEISTLIQQTIIQQNKTKKNKFIRDIVDLLISEIETKQEIQFNQNEKKKLRITIRNDVKDYIEK